MTDQNKPKKDLFVLDTVFPNPENIILTEFPCIEEIKDDCLIVFDASTLLAPYNVGKESLQAIHDIYIRLIKKNRLHLPTRAVKEFGNNRASKIGDIYSAVHSKLSTLPKIENITYPLLEGLTEYENSVKCCDELNKKRKEYKEALQDLQQKIESWNWNDPVSNLYSRIFTKDMMVDVDAKRADIEADLHHRNLHSIPPAYKDKSKPDDGIGDLLIWYSILKIGTDKKSNVIFVSNDEKADWVNRSQKQSLSARFELVDEFFRKTEGKFLFIVTFSSFLKLFGAKEAVVLEIKKREAIDQPMRDAFPRVYGSEMTRFLTSLNEMAALIEAFLGQAPPPPLDLEDDLFGMLLDDLIEAWAAVPELDEFRMSVIKRAMRVLDKMTIVHGKIFKCIAKGHHPENEDITRLIMLCKKFLARRDEVFSALF